MIAWLRSAMRKLNAHRQCAFTGSTIAEIDTDTGELICVPGQHPPRERWLLARAWATLQASRR